MSTFHVSIRVNVRPSGGSALVEHVAPFAQSAGLRLRNDVPGLLEGSAVSLEQLGRLLTQLGELPTTLAITPDLLEAGLLDDVWVHVSRNR